MFPPHRAGPLEAGSEIGVPVTLENDLVALAEAERWFGLGRDLTGFVVITIGVGIGYTLVVNGEVVHTPDAGVGLGGHLPPSATGPICQEGHRGCAQAMLTSGSIAAQVSAALQRTVDYDEAVSLARDGNVAASAVVASAGQALGRFVALATNLTLQPAVVLAGDGIELFAVADEPVRAAMAEGRDPRVRAGRALRRRAQLHGLSPRRSRRRDPGRHPAHALRRDHAHPRARQGPVILVTDPRPTSTSSTPPPTDRCAERTAPQQAEKGVARTALRWSQGDSNP